MSGMTWSARTIGAKVVTVVELSLVERSAIEICDLVTNLNGVLEGTFFLSELLNEGTRRSDNQRWHLDHIKAS